jgi:predicted DNA-binding WGR domain protein
MSTAATTGIRRFEFSEGSSNRFWEIQVQVKDVHVRFGRIGATGQTNVKSFPDEAAAAKLTEKLVKEKIGKGYREIE